MKANKKLDDWYEKLEEKDKNLIEYIAGTLKAKTPSKKVTKEFIQWCINKYGGTYEMALLNGLFSSWLTMLRQKRRPKRRLMM